jgi:hypothetical protein
VIDVSNGPPTAPVSNATRRFAIDRSSWSPQRRNLRGTTLQQRPNSRKGSARHSLVDSRLAETHHRAVPPPRTGLLT